jgi:hypothetical protein
VSAPTEVPGREAQLDRQPGQWFDVRPHGSEAAAMRERRAGKKPCDLCRAAENAAHNYRRDRRRASASPAPLDLEVRSDD